MKFRFPGLLGCVFAGASALAVTPSHSPYRGHCETHLVYKDAALRADPTWEKIFRLLPLNAEDQQLGRDVVGYYVDAYNAAGRGEAPGQFRHPFLKAQARRLLQIFKDLIDVKTQVIEHGFQFFDDELIGVKENVDRARQASLRSGSLVSFANKRQSLMDRTAKVDEHKRIFEADVQDLWRTLNSVHAALVEVEQSSGGPTLMMLLQFESLAAIFIENAEHFSNQYSHPVSGPIGQHFSLSFDFDRAMVLAWTNRVRRAPLAPHPLEVLGLKVRRRIQAAANQGSVLVPWVGNISRSLPLAVAFLPIHLIPLNFNSDRPSDNWLHRWSLETNWPSHITQESRQGLTTLWASDLNHAWNVWYLLLGGNLTSALSLHQPRAKRNAVEALIRSLLSACRYGGALDEGHDWDLPGRTLEMLYANVLFSDRLANALHHELWIGDDLVTLPESTEVAAALDVLVARLNMHPDLQKNESDISRAIARHPVNAVTKHLESQKEVLEHELDAPSDYARPFSQPPN